MLQITFRVFIINNEAFQALSHDHDIGQDLETIEGVVRQYPLFNGLNIEAETDPQQGMITLNIHGINLEAGPDVAQTSSEAVQWDLRKILVHSGLRYLYTVSRFREAVTEGDRSVIVPSIDAEPEPESPGNPLELALEKFNFPNENIPKHFFCVKTKKLMFMPMCDVRSRQYKIETYYLLDTYANPTRTHPVTGENIRDERYTEIDFVLRDEILTFVRKVGIVHENGQRYEANMDDILSRDLSAEELSAKLDEGAAHRENTAANDYSAGFELYHSKRYSGALYYLLSAVRKGLTNERQLFSAERTVAKIYILQKNYDDAEALLTRLVASPVVTSDAKSHAEELQRLAEAKAALGKFEEAMALLETSREQMPELEGAEESSAASIERANHMQKNRQLFLLSKVRLEDTYANRCTGLIRVIERNDRKDIHAYLTLFSDIDFKKARGTLRTLVDRGDVSNARLLLNRMTSFGLDTPEYVPTKQILESPDAQMRALLGDARVVVTLHSNVGFSFTPLGPAQLEELKEALSLPENVTVTSLTSNLLLIRPLLIARPLQGVFTKLLDETLEKIQIGDNYKLRVVHTRPPSQQTDQLEHAEIICTFKVRAEKRAALELILARTPQPRGQGLANFMESMLGGFYDTASFLNMRDSTPKANIGVEHYPNCKFQISNIFLPSGCYELFQKMFFVILGSVPGVPSLQFFQLSDFEIKKSDVVLHAVPQEGAGEPTGCRVM